MIICVQLVSLPFWLTVRLYTVLLLGSKDLSNIHVRYPIGVLTRVKCIDIIAKIV